MNDAASRILAALGDDEHGAPPVDDGDDRCSTATAGESSPRPSQATQLVQLAQGLYRFGFSTAGEPFAVPIDGPNVALMFRGGRTSLRAELSALFCDQHRRAPSSSALADALLTLEGMAQRIEPTEVALRVAMRDRDVVLDLGTTSGEVVVITPLGWHVTTDSPVLFRRTELTGPLVVPVGGGNLEELRRLVNVSDETWPLLVAWLVIAMLPDLPHPILLARGEQGAGKSSLARLLGSLIDASPVPLRTAPADIEAWAVAASGSYVVPLDNVTTIPPWLSDALCRAVTGDGLVKRRLYSDAGLVVLSIKRVVILTSIDAGALRGDLADRLLPVDLERLGEGERRRDEELAGAFAAAHPRLLGAVCELVSQVLALLPTIHLDVMPRMADAARVMAAVDMVMSTDSLSTYLALGKRMAAEVVEGDAVAGAVRNLVATRGTWSGTSAELLDVIRPEHPGRGWPADPTRLSGRLRRAAPTLRAVGVNVEHIKVQGTKLIRLSQGVAESLQGVASVPSDTLSDTLDGAGQGLFSPQGVAEAAETPTPLCPLSKEEGGNETPPRDKPIRAALATQRHPGPEKCGRCGEVAPLISWAGLPVCRRCIDALDAATEP
ncbi:MAG: ATP-binding protein [Actinomycetota bacterium]|nr:ATP-binding protein [Actinomycetota bacterium]